MDEATPQTLEEATPQSSVAVVVQLCTLEEATPQSSVAVVV